MTEHDDNWQVMITNADPLVVCGVDAPPPKSGATWEPWETCEALLKQGGQVIVAGRQYSTGAIWLCLRQADGLHYYRKGDLWAVDGASEETT